MTGVPFARERIVTLLEGMRGRRVAVVGDAMLDVYLVGDVERISPEAPVPVVHVTERKAAVGGAANVAANVAAIGAHCRLVAAVGTDARGETLREALGRVGLDDGDLVALSDRPTTSKTRVVARGQQVVRFDEEVDSPLGGEALAALMARALEVLDEADALLLEDYNKGVLGPPSIALLIEEARKREIPVVADPKYRNFFAYRGATLFKPNRRELETALGAAVDLDHPDALPAAIERLEVSSLLVTLGAKGMLLVAGEAPPEHIPAVAREVYDVSGAGDTVAAWVTTALAAGASVREAAFIANWAASVGVTRLGAVTVAPNEVLDVYDRQYDQPGRWRREGVL